MKNRNYCYKNILKNWTFSLLWEYHKNNDIILMEIEFENNVVLRIKLQSGLITFSVLVLFESGLTRMDWGQFVAGLSSGPDASCKAAYSRSFWNVATEGAAGSVIHPVIGLLLELKRKLLKFFFCIAGEYPDVWSFVKCCELDGTSIDVWEKWFDPGK